MPHSQLQSAPEFAAKGGTYERARCVYLGVVYKIWGTRNAYHGRLVDHTLLPSDVFHPNFESARRVAEQERVQGTEWFIRELPALVVQAENNDLIISDDLTINPFDAIEYMGTLSRSTRDISVAFRATKGAKLLLFFCKARTIENASLPFRLWKSRPGGHNKSIDWNISPEWNPDLTAIILLQNKLTHLFNSHK